MALYLTQEVISNAFADLNDQPVSGLSTSNINSTRVVSEPPGQNTHRKRKHRSGALVEHLNGTDLEIEAVSRKLAAPLAVKIAALRALEALLTVGGSLRSEFWRTEVDLVLITVATNACDAGWASEEKLALPSEPASSLADYQLAALEALLASLLSTAHVRPPYLSQGLELFRRGKQETGTKLAAFCAHALLALEVLIHPRALALVDFPVAKMPTSDGFNSIYPKNTSLTNQKLKVSPFMKGNLGANSDLEDDELYNSWLHSEEEAAGGSHELVKNIGNTEQLVEHPIENPEAEKHDSVDSTRNTEPAEMNPELPHTVDVEMREVSLVNTGKSQEPSSNNSGPDQASHDLNTFPGSTEEASNRDVVGNPMHLTKDVDNVSTSSAAVLNRSELATNSSNNVINLTKDGSSGPEKLSASIKGKATVPFNNSDSESTDSLPDIVDADPDSD